MTLTKNSSHFQLIRRALRSLFADGTGGMKKPAGMTGHPLRHGTTTTRTMSSPVEIQFIQVMMEWS